MKSELIQIPDGYEKATEFVDFCKWSAQPKDIREPQEQQELAKKLGVDKATLCRWKETDEFVSNRKEYIRKWLGDDLPDVMHVVKKWALKGSSKHIDTFLKWLGELTDSTYIDARTQTINNYQATPEQEALLDEWVVKRYKELEAEGKV
jgi:hypothetical protein